MAFKTKAEKRAFRKGILKGLFGSKKTTKSTKKVSQTKKSKKIKHPVTNLKTFSFQAFNDNCDVFNVVSKGKTREEAQKYAQKMLPHDPSVKGWKVVVTNDKADFEEYARIVDVTNGKVTDNFPYR